MSAFGTCDICGGDWDAGSGCQPAYTTCTCEEDNARQEDAHERAAARARDNDFEDTGRDWT